MAPNDISTAGPWTRQWWRGPGDSLFAGIVDGVQINVEFTWCNDTEWGLRIKVGDEVHDQGFFDVVAESLVH